MANRYSRLLREPRIRPLLLAGATARLPLGMNSLAVLLLVRERTGSFATAGAVAAAVGAGYALVGPAHGRIVDRLGQTVPLVAATVAHTIAYVVLLVAATGGASGPVMVALAGVAGATTPPVASSQRAMWPAVLATRPALLDTALAVDAMLLDVFLIVGPLLVGAVASVASPAAALGLGATMTMVGALWFAAQEPSRAWRGEGRRRGSFVGPLSSPGVRTMIATILLTGIALGAVNVGLTGFADDRGNPAAVGLFLSTLGAGSLAGGLWYGGRSWTMTVDRRYFILLAAFAMGLAPLALAPSVPVMVVLTVTGGFFLAPVTACEFVLLRRVAPDGTVTEAYAWGITATFAGAALGRALSGVVVEATDWRVALVGTCLLAAAAFVVAVVRVGTLREGAPDGAVARPRVR